jgi:hypothetical protein
MLVEAKALWDADQLKVVLPTILVTSFVTAVITEPVKVWIQSRSKKRQIRRSVLAEVGMNLLRLNDLARIVSCHEDQITMSETLLLAVNRTAYDGAQRDFYLYNQIPEVAWLNEFYLMFAVYGGQVTRRLQKSESVKPGYILDANNVFHRFMLVRIAAAFSHASFSLGPPSFV